MASQQALALTVNYDLGVVEAVAAGQYGYANPDITSEHFPTTRRGTEPLEAVLVHFDRVISSEGALAELEQLGLRAGELPELLALGAQHPNEQRKHPTIIALGSVWQDPVGDRNVPYLDDWGGKRGLILRGFDWRGACRFLAFRK